MIIVRISYDPFSLTSLRTEEYIGTQATDRLRPGQKRLMEIQRDDILPIYGDIQTGIDPREHLYRVRVIQCLHGETHYMMPTVLVTVCLTMTNTPRWNDLAQRQDRFAHVLMRRFGALPDWCTHKHKLGIKTVVEHGIHAVYGAD